MRLIKMFTALLFVSLALSVVSAQNNSVLTVGDPPVAALINISAPDADGVVSITGAAGAVFPGAQVAIRNLYTEEIVYVQAGITGSFSAFIYGPGNTPFWISPASNIPNNLRDRPGSLPGGPGTIIYGQFPQTLSEPNAVTQIAIDGNSADWETYPDTMLFQSVQGTVYGLLNQESLYIALAGSTALEDYALMQVVFSLDGALYNLTFDPRVQRLAQLERLDPNPTVIGAFAAFTTQAEAVEIRIPYATINPNNPTIEASTLEQIRFLNADSSERSTLTIAQPVPILAEIDGIAQVDSQLGDDYVRFVIGGAVAQGANRWTARGRINQLSFQPGDTLILEMDVSVNAPNLPAGLVGLSLIGQLGLQPLIDSEGLQVSGGINSNNGWSRVLTSGGLAVDHLRSDFILGEALAFAPRIVRRAGQLLFPLNFSINLPDDLPAGIYIPYFQGIGQVGDGDIFRWEDNSVLGTGAGISRVPLTRLPLSLNVGDVTDGRLLWTLFYDTPSDGSRGLISDEDSADFALSNRVRLNSATYILPPSDGANGDAASYPLEPYLLYQMPNAYDTTSAPLIPFLFPGGRISGRITRPDGSVDDLGSSAFFQNRLSTTALDERVLFGGQSPLDSYRLTTLNPLFTRYVFDQYGEYQISLTGNMEDTWGNRYEGGGTYNVLIAEPLAIYPAALPGTPFEVGNFFTSSLRLSPGFPADVRVNLTFYPLDGDEPQHYSVEGQANRFGYFHADDEAFEFDTPGEYVVDYEVRYTEADGKLWAASLRGAGVVANTQTSLIAHGQRGVDNVSAETRPSWFNIAQYLGLDFARLTYPYYSGDVAWVRDTSSSQIKPVIQVQDTVGVYADWLLTNAADFVGADGKPITRLAVEAELPLLYSQGNGSSYNAAFLSEPVENQAYSYISMIRPDVTARQFVQGSYDHSLLTYWDAEDPYNQQIGAGITGDRLGDFLFMFGGAVVRNEAAGVLDADIYGALAVLTDGVNDTLGTRVYPPYRGQAGGPNGGPLFFVQGQPINMFFHPTSIRPGSVLEAGDTFSIAGQVAPTLPSIVSVNILTPSGQTRSFEGLANAVGYYYDPINDFTVDEIGTWTVNITVRHEGVTSAGMIEPPPPTGDVLGTIGGTFLIYVVPAEGESLVWNNGETRTDIYIPPAIPFNFNFQLPEGWTDVQVLHSIATPTYLVEDGPLRISGQSFSYQYNPTNLSRAFPNLESNGLGVGAAASDVVTLTFMVTGSDALGRPQAVSRTFTVMHDRLMTAP